MVFCTGVVQCNQVSWCTFWRSTQVAKGDGLLNR